jgi:catechol 2,3-dioxygenase-like lactoylglutathione lyase family enzyme
MNPIRHIEFWSSDVEKSVLFYESFLSMLGWARVDKNGLVCDQTKIYFCGKTIPLRETLGPRHICFRADNREDVDKIADALKSRGISILHGPGELHPGSYMVVFKDLDGYILEVSYKTKE